MDECCWLLLIKIVFLLILSPLCQLGSSEFKFPSDPQLYNNQGTSGLPDSEVKALKHMMSSLQLKAQPLVSNSYCDEKPKLSSNIIFNCSLVNRTWHISHITMENVGLTGEIPEDVEDFIFLETLDLSSNKIHGSIPYKIGHLFHLVVLDLSENQLTGTIPASLGNLKNLEQLDLSQNLLTGKIPISLGSLPSLEYLSLWSNHLSGEIPHELGNLSQLQSLMLMENRLAGALPPEVGKLSNLEDLWLASNNLSGQLPKEYENLKNVMTFNMAGNNLSGPVPKFITEWVNLIYLNLIGNNFQGELPPAIFNMLSLEYLFVNNLPIKGFAFPKSANLKSIFSLVLRNCSITGTIPSYIANWSSTLRLLDLSFNNLTGGVPDDFKRLNLDELYLTGNKLNGTLPSWIYSIVEKIGDLAYNEFKFPEPKIHENLRYKINIEPRNRTFPEEIMNKYCPAGKRSQNHYLHINAGGEDTTIEDIHYEADKSTSYFYVNKPAYNWAYSCNGYFQDSSLANYSSAFIQTVTCGASVTDAPLYEKARLCPNSLKYYGLCLHNGNYTVRLHFSEIVFVNDDDYSSSAKRLFDIYLQRELRKKDFIIKEEAGHSNNVTIQNFSVIVQDNLLEIELLWVGRGSIYNPPYLNGPLISAISIIPNFKENHRGLPTIGIVGIVLAAAILVLILLLALMWRLGWLGDRELRVNTVNLKGKSYTVKQVKDATRNFSPRNVIGTGRFGIVYKAELPDRIVAVKKLSSQSNQVIDQIGTEVYALKALKHENIVEFLDGYSKKDLNLLIYEYTEKGSLERALFDANSSTRLDWPTRVTICVGVAKGLKYLHEDNPNRKIVHRNIKPSNILLDGNLNAKVSDLGLAKLYDEENPYKFIQEKGTVVYMAPEYAMRKAITDKVDVFSFGIVMLEIVSGQTNAKYEANQETVFLLDTAMVLHAKERLYELVDKDMPINREVKKQAIEILELAMRCVDQSPTLRPTMSEVVSVLEHISSAA